MIRFSLLGSGSSGNAILVMSSTTKILVDNGLSFRQLERRMDLIGESPKGLAAVFVTHEHGDHVNGVGVLSRKIDVPVYMTGPTYDRLPRSVGTLNKIKHFESGDSIPIGDLTVQSFQVAHDAADPVSYVVRSPKAQLGIATDLGKASHLVRQRLAGSHALILESNYCPDMLRKSPYPAAIVQRIAGSHGHLSNPDMNSLLSDLLHDALQLVVAVHISQENNTEDKARAMAARVLRGHPAELYISCQDDPTPMFEIGSDRVVSMGETA